MSEENVGLYMGSLAEELFQKLLLQDKYFTHNCTYNLCVCHAYCPYLWKITSNIIPQSIEKYITISFLELKSYHNFLHWISTHGCKSFTRENRNNIKLLESSLK